MGNSQFLDRYLEVRAAEAGRDMPEDLFLSVSRLTPIINVDLLIKDNQNRTLLTWRDDEFYRAGWHIRGHHPFPGNRRRACAGSRPRVELGAEAALNQTLSGLRR